MSKYPSAFLILSLILFGCAAPPKTAPDPGSPVAEFPRMAVGDSWTVLQHHNDHGTVKVVYEVTSVEADGSFDIKGKSDKWESDGFKHFDSSATGVNMMTGIQFDPKGLQFPLFVGKAWETEADSISTSGNYQTYRTKYQVEEFTTVKTQVGIFEAFRIKANVKNIGTNWKGRSFFWYAPEARVVVKTEHPHIRGVKLLEMDLKN